MAAADTARLVAELTLDDKRFTRGMASANKSLGSFDKALSRAGKGMSTAASNLGKLGAIGGGLAVAGLAASVQEASNLNEQLSKSSVVFGKASKDVIAFSETTAESLGLAQSSTLEAAGAFGNMFLTTGLAEDAAADMSVEMVKLAADMASFNNEDPTEMLDRLRSGLSGEAEPLRRFGVLLSEAAVQQEAYATGIAETGEKLTEAQKVQARYSLILKQTKVQQGDFARTSGSLANQQRILSANLRNTGAVIGTALLPKITEIAVKINKLIKENQPAIEAFAAQLPGAFDRALAFAERIPWETIGRGLETAATWAGKLMEVFLNLPPEVQTTLIALAGLNKLSGGAITGVVSELGKGLIKGVLGMTAGVVNIKAATVTGVGGVPGAAGAAGAGGKGGVVGTAGKVLDIASKVLIVGLVADIASQIDTEIANSLKLEPSQASWPWGPKNTPTILPEVFGGNGLLGGEGAVPVENKHLADFSTNAQRLVASSERQEAQEKSDNAKIIAAFPPVRSEMIGVRQSVISTNQRTITQLAGDSSSERSAITRAASDQNAAQARTTEAARSAAAAIRDKKWQFTTNVTVQQRLTVNNLTKGVDTYNRITRVES